MQRKSFRLKFLAVSFCVFLMQRVYAADGDDVASLRQEMEVLKAGQKDVLHNLKAIKDILMGKQPLLDDVFVTIGNSPSIGDKQAEVVIVEFTDFQCPYCRAYHREVFTSIAKDYVETGLVRYVSRNFPLEDAHPLAEKAAEAALCFGEQGRYWEAHDRFFTEPEKLQAADMVAHAVAIGADPAAMQTCLVADKYRSAISRDIAEGEDLGVRGTPSFFIGVRLPGDPSRIRAVRLIPGNAPFREFKKAIRSSLDLTQKAGSIKP